RWWTVLVPLSALAVLQPLEWGTTYRGYMVGAMAGITFFVVSGYVFVGVLGRRLRPRVLFRVKSVALLTTVSVPLTIAYDLWTATGEWAFLTRPLGVPFPTMLEAQVPFTLYHLLSSLIFVPLFGTAFLFLHAYACPTRRPEQATSSPLPLEGIGQLFESFLALLQGLCPRLQFGLGGLKPMFAGLEFLAGLGDLLHLLLLRLHQRLLFRHPVVQLTAFRLRGLLRVLEEAHRLRLDVRGVFLALRERGGLRFEFLRALGRFDGRPFDFPLFLRAPPLFRGGLFFRTLEVHAPPVRLGRPLLESLRGLGRLEFLLLEG